MSRAAVSKTAPDRRKMMIYGVITLVVIAAIIAVGLLNRSSVPKSASEAPITSHLKVGDTAPEFAVQTNAGPFDLNSVSTPVLVEIFATWCPHCQRETAVLNEIASKYAGKIAIVSVSGSPTGMDGNSPESQADVNSFGQQFQVRYPLAFDPDMKVAQEYIGSGFPTLVMIDKNKKVTWMTSGETAEPTIAKAINATL